MVSFLFFLFLFWRAFPQVIDPAGNSVARSRTDIKVHLLNATLTRFTESAASPSLVHVKEPSTY